MSAEKKKLLNPHALRCEPYNDGHWCFAYDPSHAEALLESGAHDALLGFASGVDADERVERIAEAGMAIAWELTGDGGVVVDVLVGKKLTSGQKAKAEWLAPQTAYLSVPSGRLRIETLSSLAIGPDEPYEEGCEVEVPAGEYDVALHRVAWELMDEDSEERPEIPTEVLALSPVKRGRAKRKAASLSLAEALGEVGAWLMDGRVEDGAFLGTTRAHMYDTSIVHTNLRGAHAERMGLRFGDTLELEAGDVRVTLPFIGYLTELGMEAYFGPEWFENHFRPSAPYCTFSPFQASTPWLVDARNSELPVDSPMRARVGPGWCEAPVDLRGAFEVEKGAVTGRFVWVSEGSAILSFGWAQLRAAKVGSDGVLELASGDQRRRLCPTANAREFIDAEKQAFLVAAVPQRAGLNASLEAAWARHSKALSEEIGAKYEGRDPTKWSKALKETEAEIDRLKAELEAAPPPREALVSAPLLADTLTFWDDPEVHLLWLRPLVGDRLFLDVEPGAEVTLRLLE